MTQAENDIIQDAINQITQGCDIESNVGGIDASLYHHIAHHVRRIEQVLILADAQNGNPAAMMDDDGPANDWRGVMTL